MLAAILSHHHGFECWVLFAQDEEGTINPDRQDRIPGTELLDQADLLVIFTRFRSLPDSSMHYLEEYLRRGKPVIGLRTATHAFAFPADSAFFHFSYDCDQSGYQGGFGRRVLGETWISHHGEHGRQSTRGILSADASQHPVLRGVAADSIWGPTDVYGVRLPLPDDAEILVYGQVLQGMAPDDPPAVGALNQPMMPVAWTKHYTWQDGPSGRALMTTMGASQDFQSIGLRRMLVNACYWATGLEDRIPDTSQVEFVGPFDPSPFGFGGYRKNVPVVGKLPSELP